MKKYKKKVNKKLHISIITLIFTLLRPIFFGAVCHAQEYDADVEVRGDVEGVIEDFTSALPDGVEIEDLSDVSEKLGVKSILSGIINAIKGEKGNISAFLFTLLGIGLIGAVASVGEKETCVFASRAVGIVSAALLFERLAYLVTDALESLEEIDGFFGALIPVSLAVNSIGASPSTASVQAVGMGVTLSAYSFISQKLLAPIVTAIFVASASSGIDPLFARIAKGVKAIFLWVVGIFTALVGATFSLQSAISAGADSAVIRSARYAISGSIPIVGNAVSGALGVVAGGVSYARGLVGGGAIAVLFVLTLAPLVTLILYRLCLRLGIFFASTCSLGGCESVLNSFLCALDALVAVYALTVTVYTVELVAFLKGGASFA